jgi:hypothetical protein
MNLTLDQLRDFAARYTAAWCSQNPEAVAAFFSPNGSLKINEAVPSVGRTAITESARGFMSDFPDLKISMNDLILRGPRTEYHWTLEGTNTGPGGTGPKVRIIGYEEWKFGADGLLEDSLGHFDATEYARQLAHGFDDSLRGLHSLEQVESALGTIATYELPGNWLLAVASPYWLSLNVPVTMRGWRRL